MHSDAHALPFHRQYKGSVIRLMSYTQANIQAIDTHPNVTRAHGSIVLLWANHIGRGTTKEYLTYMSKVWNSAPNDIRPALSNFVLKQCFAVYYWVR